LAYQSNALVCVSLVPSIPAVIARLICASRYLPMRLSGRGKVGGVGEFEHLIPRGRSGLMTHAEAKSCIRRFAGERLPLLCEAVHRGEDRPKKGRRGRP
jgi:hypothetical protein